ncbi:MAG: hypothetical protein JKX81_12095 [Arenicella sp.]|nr:hypothetical protein [Arenicella sp.]
MSNRSSASKESLSKLAIVSCLLLTQFACNETNSVRAQATSVNAQDVKSNSSVNETVSNKLMLDLAVDQGFLDAGKFALIATLKNGYANEISFLPWANPFEENVTADFLTIVDLKAGAELPYRGIMIKRMPPKPSDYRSLAPQKSIRNTIDLSRSYKFCAHQKLKVVFSGALYSQLSTPYNLEVSSLELVLPDAFPDC